MHAFEREGRDVCEEALEAREPDGSLVDVNATKRFGPAIIHWASQRNSIDLLELLLSLPADRGLDVNALDRLNYTPLHACCNVNAVEHIKLLLKREDVDINIRNEEGQTAVMAACRVGGEAAELLITHPRTSLAAVANNGYTALHAALSRGHRAVVETLLQCPDVDPNLSAGSGPPVLHCPSKESLRHFLQAAGGRVNVNFRDENGSNLLHFAAIMNQPDYVAYVLELVDPSARHEKNDEGHTPLEQAQYWRMEKVVAVLQPVVKNAAES